MDKDAILTALHDALVKIEPDGSGHDAALERLMFWRIVADEVETVVEHGVISARALGASWAEVGDALAVTKQSAHRKYS